MSEAYWLGGLRQDWNLPSDVDALRLSERRMDVVKTLASQSGLSPARLQRVDWFTSRMNSLYRREVFDSGERIPLAFLWPALPLFTHSLLRGACAALVADEGNLAALVEENPSSVEATLLGSPAAVGKYNLAPRARFNAHFSAAWEHAPLLDTFDQAAAFLKKNDVGPEAIGALALSSPIPSENLQKPPAWQTAVGYCAQPEHGLLDPLNWLAANLPSGEARFGLLASFSADHRALFTLVEKV